VLVSGTLVYSRGDEQEVKEFREEMNESGDMDAETLLPPLDPATPRAMPYSASTPIYMRETPSSLKVHPPFPRFVGSTFPIFGPLNCPLIDGERVHGDIDSDQTVK